MGGPLRAEGCSWPRSRDEGQRRFLSLAVERGVDHVELFANAPMWWMSSSSSSFGGALTRPADFAAYLAEVALHARSCWGIPVRSVAPFNEPSSTWWRFPHDQEGCCVSMDQQSQMIVRLRDELDRRGLNDVLVTASDENHPDAAIETWSELQRARVTSLVGGLNVHMYDGLKPWQEVVHPGSRAALAQRAAEDGVPTRVSEHGNADTSGVVLAESILEDLHHLRPTSWYYWQPVEFRSSWGLIEAMFSPEDTTPIGLPHQKYFVFAHFTRFIRPGHFMLNCTEAWATASFSPEENTISCVIANAAPVARQIRICFPTFSMIDDGEGMQAVLSEPRAGRIMVPHFIKAADCQSGRAGLELRTDMVPCAVCSVRLPARPCGLRAIRLHELVARATRGAADERLLGAGDSQTKASWSCWEETVAKAAFEYGAWEPALQHQPSDPWRHLCQMVSGVAWGAANERHFGGEHPDCQDAWERFRVNMESVAASQGFVREHESEVRWLVFNTSWAVVNERWYGAASADCQGALARSEQHLQSIGADTVVFRCL